MNPAELYEAGQLQEAISAQVQVVKAKPGDAKGRFFLVELLSFAGELERAQKQIEAISSSEPEIVAYVGTYRLLLAAETARRRLFKDGVRPQFLGDPPEHVNRRLEALDRLRGNQSAEAAQLLQRADEASPTLKGTLNGKVFTSLRDSDDVLGAVLEVLVPQASHTQGAYFWLPLEQVESLSMNPPTYPRDLLWFPARLVLRPGPSGETVTGQVYLPALYVGSHEHADEQIKLGRLTDWIVSENEIVRGAGARTFFVGEEDIPLLEWRQLQMFG